MALMIMSLTASTVTLAQDAVDRATAAYHEGMDLRASGDNARALEKLRGAHALYPTAITGLELGRTLMLMDRLKEARVMLESVSRIGPRPNESVRANSARAEAAALAVQVGERTPRLRFRRTPSDTTVAVTVDGGPVADLDSPTDVDPGEHIVVITRGAETETRSVRVKESEGLVVEIVKKGEPSPEVATEVSHDRSLFWVGVAFTGASLILGSVSGGIAIANHDTAAPSCIDNQCAPSVAGAVDAAKTWSTVSTVAFISTGVLAIVTLIAFVVAPKHVHPARVGVAALSF